MQKGAVAKVYRYRYNMYRYMLCKNGQWPRCTGTPLTCTGTCGRVKGKKFFLIHFFAPFGIHNLLHSLQSKTLAFFALSHKQPRVCLFLPKFPSLRPGFFCTHRTDVVSLLQFIESIFVLFIIIHGFVWWVLVGGFPYLVFWGLG